MAAGHILGLPIAVLGVTVLACKPHGHCWHLGCTLPWVVPAMIVRTGGNSISDLLANRAIARGNAPGAAKMAISGKYHRLLTTLIAEQLILWLASGASNEGRSSPLLALAPAISWPWVPAWGSLEPSRPGG